MKRRLTCLAAVAVVASVSAAASAASAASAAPVATGPHWVIQSTPNRAAPESQLQSVSCTSGMACTAVGSSGPLEVLLASGASRPFAGKTPNITTRITTLAERWGGEHWRIESTPNPAGSTFSSLSSVACTSRRACTAVGSAIPGKVFVPLAERWNGSRWSIERTPRPPKATSSELLGVSCPASNECIAVGDYSTSPTAFFGFAERWNGSRWTPAGVIKPSANTSLSSISCSSVRRCTAVGDYEKATTTLPLAERWASGKWHKQSTPGTGFLLGVSCPAFSQCTAVGNQPNGEPGESAVLAMQWNGAKWKTRSAPEPLGATVGFLLGVSCSAATSCVAAGWAEVTSTVTTLADHWNGTSWTLEVTRDPTGALGSSFNGVWCGAHNIECRAAGDYDLPSNVKTLIERR
jgi:hypothetical protein